jgi:hypothetical protein
MRPWDDEDWQAEMAELRYMDREARRARFKNSCSDRMCGADDCPRCRPGNRYTDQEEEGVG